MKRSRKPAKRDQEGQAGSSMGRGIGYVRRYPKVTAAAMVALIIATSAQLAVP
ncbi:MAG: hypothetical protein WA996_05435 [Candidatus Promineifilaceae bacterium]